MVNVNQLIKDYEEKTGINLLDRLRGKAEKRLDEVNDGELADFEKYLRVCLGHKFRNDRLFYQNSGNGVGRYERQIIDEVMDRIIANHIRKTETETRPITKEGLLKLVRKRYRITLENMRIIGEGNLDRELSQNDWWIYELIKDASSVTEFFPSGIIQEAKGIEQEYADLCSRCEREAFLESEYVQKELVEAYGFEWDETKNFVENADRPHPADDREIPLRPAVSQDMKYEIFGEALRKCQAHPFLKDIYERKEALERRMIHCLER